MKNKVFSKKFIPILLSLPTIITVIIGIVWRVVNIDMEVTSNTQQINNIENVTLPKIFEYQQLNNEKTAMISAQVDSEKIILQDLLVCNERKKS